MAWVPNSLGTASTVQAAPRARDEVYSASLTIKEMLRLLAAHGSANISQQIDPEGYSEVPIGVGGHGDVWKGRMRDGRDVAVKVWRQFPKTDLPKVMKRTMQEIYYWSKIRHENVHELMGVTEHQGKLGIVSLWMDHGDLRSYIERNPELDRYSWCIQVAAGVSYLRQNELIHGDLKASNVLLSKDHVARISDFDCSIVSDCSLVFSATKQMRISLRWATPELMGSSVDEDEESIPEKTKESDIYALAMTLLEIITGKSPYVEYKRHFGVLKALSDKKLPRRPESLSQTSDKHDRLWRLLVECWNHNWTARPDAQHVLELLRVEAIPPEVKGSDTISRHMSLQEIFSLLLQHGCADLSSEMDCRQDMTVTVSGGAFGDIWMGELYNGTRVAIKTIRSSLIEGPDYKTLKRAAREIYLWSRLVHPNVHQLTGVIIFKGYYLGMVSQWMENGDLREYMRKDPDFDRYQTCIQVTKGLAYMHQHDMAHGNLKATTVLVSSDGVAKLAGFSSVIMSNISLVFSETTEMRGFTIQWAAPELLLEEATKSKPADVYALGMASIR
ncbi:kinase-like domain-containing protein [Rhizoctonia solani]|nr:kinase-like domain-containing protein [Rhizoctonia solani]